MTANPSTRFIRCDQATETCPDRCIHKTKHVVHKDCSRGICGGKHAECKPIPEETTP